MSRLFYLKCIITYRMFLYYGQNLTSKDFIPNILHTDRSVYKKSFTCSFVSDVMFMLRYTDCL